MRWFSLKVCHTKRHTKVTRPQKRNNDSMPDSQTLPTNTIFELKAILEREHGRPFTEKETAEIGHSLVELYAALLDNELGIGVIKDKFTASHYKDK